MPVPTPAPQGFQGQGNLYASTYKFAQGRPTWTERYLAIVKNATKPIVLMRQASINLANARLGALSPRAAITEVRSSYVSNDPLSPVRQSYPGDAPEDGANPGIGIGVNDSPIAKCWEWAFYDLSLSVHSRRFYRGMLQLDDTWTPVGGYPPSAQTAAMISDILSVLDTPQTSGLTGGTVQYCIPSTQIVPGNSPPSITLAQFVDNPLAPPVPPLSVNGLNQIVFKFKGATPLQKGWVGITPAVPLTPVGIGDQVILSGPRVSCLTRINGTYRICSVSSSGAGASTIWTYTTTRYACCNPSQLPLWNGTARAFQQAYYPYASATPIQIATHSTGVSGGGSRGRSRASCCT